MSDVQTFSPDAHYSKFCDRVIAVMNEDVGGGWVAYPDYLALRAQRDELAEALRGMDAIVRDSRGVAGYHLNGAVAEWGEFIEVAAMESALAKLEVKP